MKKNNSRAKTILIIATALSLALIAFPVQGSSEEVDLKLWSAWPEQNEPAKPALKMLQDMINEQGESVGLSVTYKGGPEIFGPTQGTESLQKGTIDIAYTAGAYTANVIPEADAIKLLKTKPWEERKNGIYELLNKWHKEKDLVYLARGGSGQHFQGYLNEERREPDLNGLTMRIVPIYKPLAEALGAKTLTTAGGEVYTALERGIVDGFWWGGREIRPWGWHEVVNYIWGPPFWTVDVYVIMSKKTWNSLDQEQKTKLTDIMEEYEKNTHDAQVKLQNKITQDLLDSGMEKIDFSEKGKQKYLDLAYSEGWKAAIKQAERVRKLKEIVEKSN